jgi:predicted dehydrogenase
VLEPFADIAAACDLSIADEIRLPVAVIGAGAITRFAHLPAYARAGVPVAAVTDLDLDRAKALADDFGVPRVATLEEILADDEIPVVDVAVFPEAQPEIVLRALRAGKHVLAQKPIAPDSVRGAELVAAAEAAGRSLVVNHQMRYGEGVAAARAMATADWIGEVTAMYLSVDIVTDWSAWPWLVNSPRLDLMYHSIHYFDTIRALLGDPVDVQCVRGRRAGQLAAGETRTVTTMTFESGAIANVRVNHENQTGDQEALFRIDGTSGAIKGTIGLLYDYPHGRPDTVEVNSRSLPTDGWLPYPVTTRWIPDAFAGPMRALLREVAGIEPAPTRAADALRTLQLVERAYAASGE